MTFKDYKEYKYAVIHDRYSADRCFNAAKKFDYIKEARAYQKASGGYIFKFYLVNGFIDNYKEVN